MALQRNNFRCPRDALLPSPLKSTVSASVGVIVSHADLPPRQRKRVQVGSTNLSRAISTPELSPPLPAPPGEHVGQSDASDVSSAAHHIAETNIGLRKKSTLMASTGSSIGSSPVAKGLVVCTETRRRKDLALHRQQHHHQHDDGGDNLVQQELSTRTENAADPHATAKWASDYQVGAAAAAAALAEHDFFLDTRKKLHDAFVGRYGSVRAVFKAFDRDSNGVISFQRFADMVEASEVELSTDDMRRVFRQVDTNSDNGIEYQEFSEMFTASEYAEHASAYSPTKARAAAVTQDPTSSLALKFRAPLDLSPHARERMKELRLKVNGELLLKHGRDVGVHGGKTENLLIYAFKQFDGDNDGFLSYDQIKSALGKDYLRLTMDTAEMDEMVRMVDRNADEKISMKEFVQYFGAGERELPTDLIDNGRKKELAALHVKANATLTPREEVDPQYVERRAAAAAASPTEKSGALPTLEPGGCMQEKLTHRIATSPVFRSPPSLSHNHFQPPRAQTSHGALAASQSTPSLRAKRDLGPTLSPLTPVSQDRFLYWRMQQTDWSRVGVGGDGVRADTALFAGERDRFQTTAMQAFNPIHRGVNSSDVSRDAQSTSELEAQARAARRQVKHEHTQRLLAEMETRRAQELRLADWKQRARVRLGAERRFQYLDKIHDQDQRVAMREQHMAKRHGGVRFHRMWAGSADSQFNSTHVTGELDGRDTHFSQ